MNCKINTHAHTHTSRHLAVAVVPSLVYVRLFAALGTAAHQAPLSYTLSPNLLKFMSIELVMLSNHLTFCFPTSFCLPFFLASESFPMSWLFTSGGQSIRASASVLPMNIQRWFPLGLIDWFDLLAVQGALKSLSSTIRKHEFFNAQPFLWFNSHIRTWLLEKP